MDHQNRPRSRLEHRDAVPNLALRRPPCPVSTGRRPRALKSGTRTKTRPAAPLHASPGSCRRVETVRIVCPSTTTSLTEWAPLNRPLQVTTSMARQVLITESKYPNRQMLQQPAAKCEQPPKDHKHGREMRLWPALVASLSRPYVVSSASSPL